MPYINSITNIFNEEEINSILNSDIVIENRNSLENSDKTYLSFFIILTKMSKIN
jgi:hypothetical protein